jgi:hypothetical protein
MSGHTIKCEPDEERDEPIYQVDANLANSSILRQSIRNMLMRGIKRMWEYSSRCRERPTKAHSGLQKMAKSPLAIARKNRCRSSTWEFKMNGTAA